MNEIFIRKAHLRSDINRIIKGMTPGQREQESLQVCNNLSLWPEFQKAGSALLYAASWDEVDLFQLMTSTGSGQAQAWYFPRVAGGLLSFHRVWDKSQLVRGSFGLLEPAESAPSVTLAEIDCLLIPGRAFDPLTGARLGRGGGFYDRALAQVSHSAKVVGVAFCCQIVGGIPRELHDQKMRQIVSPNGLEMAL